MRQRVQQNALPPGYTLLWYVIETSLGQGTFGITYLARDTTLDEPIAIKEYLPTEYGVRKADESVHPISDNHVEDFNFGFERFVSQAEGLQHVDHPNIVRVTNVFEANNTAYMVMKYEQGESLEQILAKRGFLEEAALLNIVIPILDGLEKIHAAGLIHRDINEANIWIRKDGSPVLLDFGAARLAVWKRKLRLSRSLSDHQKAHMGTEPGPWTDLHALGATLYRAALDKTSTLAVKHHNTVQANKATLVAGAEVANPGFSPQFLKAIEHALAFKPQDRPASAREWRIEFEAIQRPAPPEIPKAVSDVVAPEKLDPDPVSSEEPGAGIIYPETEAQPVAGVKRELAVRRNLVILALLFAANVGLFMLLPEKGHVLKTSGNPEIAAQQPAPLPVLEVASPELEVQPAEPMSPAEPVEPITEEFLEIETLTPEQQEIARIDQLLKQTKEDMDALRLTKPKGNNALEKYREILTIDVNNREATRGIAAIVDKYLQLAYLAMDKNQLIQAEQYLHRAANVSPQAKQLRQAQHKLRNKKLRQSQHKLRNKRSKDLPKETFTARLNRLTKSMDDFSNQTRSRLPPQKSESRFEELRRRMGGDL